MPNNFFIENFQFNFENILLIDILNLQLFRYSL